MRFAFHPVLVIVLVTGGCVDVKPTVLDHTRQLENQVLGELTRVERAVVLASSVRSPGSDFAESSDSHSMLEAEGRRAARRRVFNRDDIQQAKSRGLVGERLDGTLAWIKRPASRRHAMLLSALMREENSDRHVLWRRIIDRSTDLTQRDMPVVRRIFSRLQLEIAFDADLFQHGRDWVTAKQLRSIRVKTADPPVGNLK